MLTLSKIIAAGILFLVVKGSLAFTEIEKIKYIEIEDSVEYDILRQRPQQLEKVISLLLINSGYELFPQSLKIQLKQNLVVGWIETTEGKKFLKLHRKGFGLSEFLGTLQFQSLAPTISAERLISSSKVELLIQPWVSSIVKDGGMLYDEICALEFAYKQETIQILTRVFRDMLELHSATMYYGIGGARNDRLFFDRLKTLEKDGYCGRIDSFYVGKFFRLLDLTISWEELKHVQWYINGIQYQETLEELLLKARQLLHPSLPRLIGICHGDWHEMNIATYVENQAGESFDYAYLDLELAGENDIIGDFSVYLTYLTLFGDYLTPKYHPSQFYGREKANAAFEKSQLKKLNLPFVSYGKNTIHIDNAHGFGTLDSRKEIARLFINHYFQPLIEKVKQRYSKEITESLEKRLCVTLLLRFIGVYNISELLPEDQVKIFVFIYQTLGTPEAGNFHNESTIERFMHAL